MNRWKESVAALMLVGVILGGCSSTTDSDTTSPATSSAPGGTGTTSQTSTASTDSDGYALLNRAREVAETNMQSGNVYTTSVRADSATLETMMAENQKPHAEADDVEYDASEAATVSLDGRTATVEQTGTLGADAVTVADGSVTITSAGTYILSGDFKGQVVVNTEDAEKVRLVLDGANISSETDAAIRVLAADEVVVILADGSENTLSDTSSYADDYDGPTAALASQADLTIGGNGALSVTGNGNDGISSSDGLAILGGTVTVNAVDDAVRGKDYVVVAGGSLTLDAPGDAIKSDNEDDIGRGYVLLTGGTIAVTRGDSDAIDATSDLIIAGGTLNVSEAEEGLEAAYILLGGGSGTITSSDDGINATSDSGTPWLSITGGEWTLLANGDGIDSNGDCYMSGGTVTVYGPTNGGNGSIDAMNELQISGGTLFAAGAAGMAQAPNTNSAQASVMLNTSTISSGATVAILDSDGNELASYTIQANASNVVFSSPDIVSGQTYTVTADGQRVGTATAGDYQNAMEPDAGGPAGAFSGGQGGEPGGTAPGGG
ncbi:carbohydrate-binding domain-containing protein [Actinobaculum sp. 352]|uniref:carbohydrate-binding domain-containing protein n=1 Tax=Actinobaculum sp. 352 TaxID=2490946 RepID=UPI000F7DDF63|nr:carbohydrate-binding domain-containing protein [Actinobaculum sp. 352]RTE48174.1 carbohydrate-binding domain-containing protein [Actinobaculum sp. 352]